MNIIIVGCGKIGSTILESLVEEGHDVVGIDTDEKVINEMTNMYDVMGVCGSGTDCEMLTEAGILQNGSTFTDIYVFQKEDVTNILFPFDGVDLNIGKLAMWKLQTHHAFYGTWLSDYVPNYLGGFIDESQYATDKPDCALIGEDGNVFNLIGKAAKTLRRCGLPEQAKEMSDRVFACGSYGEALNIIGEYVNITDAAHVREYRPSVVKKIKDAKVAEPSETPKQHKPQER